MKGRRERSSCTTIKSKNEVSSYRMMEERVLVEERRKQ